MVERYGRGKGKRKILGSHQKCWIWGRNLVLETLRAGKWPILDLHLADRLAPELIDEAQQMAAEQTVAVEVEPAEVLTRRCRSAEHQGFLARMSPFPYDKAGRVLADQSPSPLYVILDSIQDPYNFGAILRSAEVMGVDAVIVAAAGQVEVTSLVARSSAGAVNYVRIVKTDDLLRFVQTLKQGDIAVIAAAQQSTTQLSDCDLRRPTALMIGNEGSGICAELLQWADEQVSIPQYGRVGSLNAAVAAGILLYEARRQRVPKSAND